MLRFKIWFLKVTKFVTEWNLVLTFKKHILNTAILTVCLLPSDGGHRWPKHV
jgi:hypothetical protein